MAIVRKTINDIKNTPINQQELDRLATMPDSEIDYNGMPEWTDKQLANAKKGSEVFAFVNQLDKDFDEHYRPVKKQVTIRLDTDVLAWLKKDGKGYQTRINNLLRQQMMTEHA